MDKHTLQVGGRYNWRNQSERLIYIGVKRHNGDYRDWHQFSLVSAPDVVWCEALDSDLEHFEESAPDRDALVKRLQTIHDDSPHLTIKQRADIAAAIAALSPAGVVVPGNIKPDTARQVFFYEQDFYVLSNFSAFMVKFEGILFATSEHAYHYQKFIGGDEAMVLHREFILSSMSAHEAFKYAEKYKHHRRPDWDDVKVEIMRRIIRCKAEQHEYVRRKLLATGDRELIEDSWRDDFWGWGPSRSGQNMLGRLWMELRAALLTAAAKEPK